MRSITLRFQIQDMMSTPRNKGSHNLKTVSEMSLTLYQRFISWLVGPILWISVIYQMGGFWLLIPCLLSTTFETLVSFAGFGKSVMNANNVRQSTMADVRYALTNIRDSAEEIALCHGESREFHRVSRLYELNLRASWRAKLVELRKGVAVGPLLYFPQSSFGSFYCLTCQRGHFKWGTPRAS